MPPNWKPAPRPKKPKRGLQRKTPPRTTATLTTKAVRRGEGKYKPATFKQAAKLRQVGRRGLRLKRQRDPWREAIFAIHGRRCLYPGCTSLGPYDVMHAYGKQAHPEWHVELWNGFPSCRKHHTGGMADTFEFDPVLRSALQQCADEMRAAMDGRRPQPSFEELQDMIARSKGGANRFE